MIAKLASFKNDNPLLYPIVKHILSALFWIFIAIMGSILAHQFITRTSASLRAEPSTNAEKIATIPKDALVIAIEDRPHWYRIEHNDFEADETYCGWVAKRTLTKYAYEQEVYDIDE